MAQQTAVEWFAKRMILNGCLFLTQEEHTLYNELKQQAKQMEKEKHGNTWDAAIKAYEDRGNLVWRSICDFDDYYNETYGNNTETK